MKNIVKNIIIFVIAFIVLAAVLSLYGTPFKKDNEVSLQTLIEQINNEGIKNIDIKGSVLEVTLKDDKKEVVKKESLESFSDLVKNYNIDSEKVKKISISVKEDSGSFWINGVLPFLLPFLLLGVFVYFFVRQIQGANNKAMMFGQTTATDSEKDKKEKVTFADVAGVSEAKEELKEIIDFLKNPKKFTSLGAKIPKGVFLVGGPGTGKTLLAKAVAGEAGVPFFSISGSEFVEMFVGVGASRVRDLFKKAKKNAPCIIFIDEIDSVGRQRGAGLGGSHDEREQTLNQILVELDGFDSSTNVIVIAATNRPDIIDPALLRPGRFDRRIVVDLPDINDREQILKVHAANKPLDAEVSLRTVAERTPGFSGADLANLLNEAALLAARSDKKSISAKDILDSIEKVILGPERKSHILSDKEKKITAFHEAGHALVAHILPGSDPVHKVSIISRGMAAGYTLKMPTEDKHFHTRSEFVDEIAVMLAGFIAEKQEFSEVTTGANSDLKQATRLAKKLVTAYGMSDKLGPRTFGEREDMIFLGREITEQRDYSEKTAEVIDSEVDIIIKTAYAKADEILKNSRQKLENIVKSLIEKETLEKEEFEKIVS